MSEGGGFDFYVPFKEPHGGGPAPARASGWQIGFLVCTCRKLHRLERHPNTAEVFCPLEGEALLVVVGERFGGDRMSGDGPAADPTDSAPPPRHASGGPSSNPAMGFLLDRPIVFNRGVWHGVISLAAP